MKCDHAIFTKMSLVSPAYLKYKDYPKQGGVNHMLVFLRSWGVIC